MLLSQLNIIYMTFVHIVREERKIAVLGEFIKKTKNCEHKIAFINEAEFKKSKEKLQKILNEYEDEEKEKIEILGCDLDKLAEEIIKEDSKVIVW
jgi:peptidase E